MAGMVIAATLTCRTDGPGVACQGNGAAKSPAKAASDLPPPRRDIPTLSGDLRIDTRVKKEAPSKSIQSKPRQPSPMPSKAEPAKPAQVEPVQPKSVQAKAMDALPPAKAKEESKADATITEIPAWDRDPTLAELKPDIEALEAALAVVPEPAAKPEAKIAPKPVSAPGSQKAKARVAPQNFDLPEIILEGTAG
jgi:hypothetical protein